MITTPIVVTKGVFARNPKSRSTFVEKPKPFATCEPTKWKTMDDFNAKNENSDSIFKGSSFESHPYQHLVGDIRNVSDSEFKNFLTLTYKGLFYCKYNLKSPPQSLISAKRVKLPPLPSSLSSNFRWQIQNYYFGLGRDSCTRFNKWRAQVQDSTDLPE